MRSLSVLPPYWMGLIVCAMASSFAQAQSYPTKPVRIIVAYTPGGGTDLIGRVLARKLGDAWAQQVVVENRPGAGGNIGTEAVAKAAPDGHTLGIAPSTHAIVPGLFSKLPFDTLRDFTFVSQVATSPNLVVCHPSVPAATVKELIALARRRPGQLTYASAGVGATTHLAGEYFKAVTAIDVVHVPYKGSSQAQIELVGGHVSFMVDSMPSGLPRVRAGKTRALATTGKQRYSALPQTPTVLESGLNYESVSWWGVVGPAGIPPPVVNKLLTDITRVMGEADVKELLATQGADAMASTPRQFLDYVRQETELYAKIIRTANIRIE